MLTHFPLPELITSPFTHAKYCNRCICMSVCLLAYVKNHTSKLHENFHTLFVAVARSSCDNSAVCYILPLSCMASCYHIIGMCRVRRCLRLRDVSQREARQREAELQLRPLRCFRLTESLGRKFAVQWSLAVEANSALCSGVKSAILDCVVGICTNTTTTTTILWPFFWDYPGEPVPEENFWTLLCMGRLTEADTLTIRLGTTPSGLTSAYLHHPPIFLQTGCPSCRSTNSAKALKATIALLLVSAVP